MEKFITFSYLQKVIEVFEDTNTHFIQVLQEAIENWHQISSCELIPQDHSQLVDGESQSAPHLPLQWASKGTMRHHGYNKQAFNYPG